MKPSRLLRVKQTKTSRVLRHLTGVIRELINFRTLSVLVLLVFFAAGVTQATHASITFDEAPHLTAGYVVWRTGDHRLQPVHIHPPLANLLASMPALLLPDLPDPASIDGWEIASLSALTDTIVWQYPEPARLIFPARLPMLFMGMLLLALVYRWTRKLQGQRAATIAILLLALDPNLIAHSALVTTDITAVFTIVLTLFTLSHYAKSKVGSRHGFMLALALGVCAGVAQLAKTSGTVILPFIAVIGLLRFIKAIRNKHKKRWLAVIGEGTILLVLVFLTLWTGYGFQIGEFHGFSLPAAIHLRMFESFREHYDLGHSAFALGRISKHGWIWYFPLAFAIKTPIFILVALLVASGLSVIRLIRTKAANHLTLDQWLLITFIAVYITSSLFSSVNIGYRHLLPLLPAMSILAAISLTSNYPSLRLPQRWQKAISIVAVIALVIPFMRSAPYPLTFFNMLIDKQTNAAKFLVDSNLDWGQNWWELLDWQHDNETGTIRVAHYSPAHLDVYGLDATYLPPSPRAVDFTPWAPEPGTYAIGATVLQGAYVADINTYSWFRAQEPAARLGNALYVYEVTEQDIPQVLVDCTYHEADFFTQNYGTAIERIIRPDCDRVEVYPAATNTHYFTSAAMEPLGTTDTILQLRDHDGDITNSLSQVDPPSPKHKLNIDFDEPLNLLGYDMDKDDETIVLRTYWQVTQLPTRPLSLMAHLVDANGIVITVDDGLGFSIDQWQMGDMLIQKHSFAVGDASPASINVGAYWLDTVERWQTSDNADHITLTVPVKH